MGSSCVIARRGRQAPDPGRRPRSSLAVLYPIVCGVPCDSRRAALVFFRLWKGLDQTERKSSPISHRMHTERAEVRKCGTRSCSPLSSLEFGMHVNVIEPGGTVVPTLRYRDVAAAIDWLCKAFGFEKHLVVNGDDGAVRYAELTFGNGMIMLGPVEDSGLDKFMTQPADTGGAETQICYLFVADAVAHCHRAKTAGAEIVLDIEDADSNGRGYSCRDLEGHIWNFGTYDPWKRRTAPAGGSNRYAAGLRGGLRRLAVAAGMVVVIIASAMVVGWALGVTDAAYLDLGTAASTSVAEAAAHPQQEAQLAREAAERTVKDFKEQLARQRGAREAAERLARSVGEQLGQER